MAFFCSLFVLSASLLFLYLLIRLGVRLTARSCESPVCMVGKTALITGGNSGLGYETALNLASRGCKVIIADKDNSDKSVQLIKEKSHNPNIFYKHIDLADFDSVRKFAKELKETEEKLDVLINNAGSWGFGRKTTKDNVPLTIQVNHLGGFLLTYLLVDLLKKSAPSRIIFVSSRLSFTHTLEIGNLKNLPSSFPHFYFEGYLYGNSKLCNIVAADRFAEILKGTGVTSNSLHPGWCSTPIFKNPISTTPLQLLTSVFSRSQRQGAQTSIYLAVSNTVENMTGKFFSDCKPSLKPSKANDKEFCDYIWKISEELVGIKPEEKL